MSRARATVSAGFALVLLLGSSVGVVAQGGADDASAEETKTPDCAVTEGADASTEACTEAESGALPVADYWDQWAEHKWNSRGRVEVSLNNVRKARSNKARFYKEAVGVHRDELMWLSNHQPEECYAAEYMQWREAVEDLRVIQKKALRFARAGHKPGLRRSSKQRQQAVKRLDKANSKVSDCGPSTLAEAGITPQDNPLVGKWKTFDNFVMPDGFLDSSRLTYTISEDGRFVLRDSNGGVCRLNGLGYVPASVIGSGEFELDGRPEFTRRTSKVYCHPRGVGRKLITRGADESAIHYDSTHDVALGELGYCWWRADSDSSTCTAYFQGVPDSVEDAEGPEDESARPVTS